MNDAAFSLLTDDGKVRLLASSGNWIEGEALAQLRKTAELPGVRLAVGLPDLHPGRGHPVGAAFVTDDVLYPQLVGNDVGCGMGFWQTDLKAQKLKQDKCVKRLQDLQEPWAGDTIQWLAQYGVEATESDFTLGTIGSGNHFAELQVWHDIHDPHTFDDLGLQKQVVSILVHSGSRGLGDVLLRHHLDQHGAAGLKAESEAATCYVQAHDRTRQWALANRALIASRMAEQTRCEIHRVLDICHNSITPVPEGQGPGWLHRKGAAPADAGAIIIPGTRGSLSYLAIPTGDQHDNAWSLAHGAGRRWNRRSAQARLKGRYHVESLVKTDLGSRVICEDKDLLYEEAPQAYKDIDVVINDMVRAGVISVVATLKPVITYKVRRMA